MHFCMDELMALLAAFPMVGFAIAWLRAKFHHRKTHTDCK
jgi:hypothetical protein